MSKPKYNIVISEGCTAFYTKVNGKLTSGEGDTMTWEEIDEIVDYLCKKFKEEMRDGTVNLDDLIKCFQCDETEYDKHTCDQCGDNVYRTIWKI